MKLRIIYTFFIFLFGTVLFLSTSGGRATSANEGNTGAPNDNNTTNNRTCQNCHNNGTFQVTPMLEITDAGGATITNNFIPGATYSVKLTVNSTGTPDGYGFQIVALNAAANTDGTPVNTWVIPASTTNVQVATIGNGRQYAEHMEISSSNEFVMDWTAPTGGGDVTFYYGGNAITSNMSTNGDNAIMASTSISADPTSTNNLEKKIALDIFPNPVQEVINLRSDSQVSGTYDLMLFDQNGRQVKMEKISLPYGENLIPINVGELSTGVYNLMLSDGENQIIKRVLKL